jgi:hypothetical protein
MAYHSRTRSANVIQKLDDESNIDNNESNKTLEMIQAKIRQAAAK